MTTKRAEYSVKITRVKLLDGRATAQKIRAEVAKGVAKLNDRGVGVGLGVVLVGDDPASHVYVGMKERASKEAGILSITERLPVHASQELVLQTVLKMNQNPDVHGVLVQHPLPKGLDEREILAAVAPVKDVDGVGPLSMGRLLINDAGFASCTAAGIIDLIEAYNIPIAGKECVVIGRSLIVGKPVAALLLNRNATVTVCHSQTQRLAEHTRRAEILVAALGVPEFVKGDMIKRDAVVIDAGYNRVPWRKGDVGDVDFEGAKERASYITPVPGGVGPMTIATLMKHTLRAAEENTRCK